MSESTEPTPQPEPPPITDGARWETSDNDADHTGLTPPPPPPEEQPNPDNAAVEGDDTPDVPPAKAEADDDPIGLDDPTPADDADAPPDFWSAEKKALWAKVTDPEVKAAIKEHVAEVARGTARKLEENAAKVRQAEESAKAALAKQDEVVNWWNQNGPVFQQLLQGKYAGYDLDKLAQENPAEWARVKQAQEQDQRWIQGVFQQHQAQMQQVQQRQAEEMQAARWSEHQKLAQEYPREFSPENSKRTYEALGKFLLDAGIPPERINGIYEAPVVKLVMDAYKYKRLQAKAREVTAPKPLQVPASKTPTRVAPGAQRQANPEGDAARQAVERLRSGVRSSELTREEAAAAFR